MGVASGSELNPRLVIPAAVEPVRRPMPRPVAVVGTAFASAWRNRTLWLLGAAAFLLRGGIFVLLLPLIVVPTPVEIRLIIGGGLGTAGITPVLMVAILVFAIVMTLLLMVVLYGLSWLELWSFQRASIGSFAASPSERKVVGRVFSVQAGALSVLALAAVPLAIGAINIAYAELVAPTGTGPLYDRIIGGVQGPLILMAAAIVVVEAVSAVYTRRVFRQEFGLAEFAGRRRWRPVVAAIGWLITLGVLVPSIWALNLSAGWVKQMLAGFQAPDLAAVIPTLALAAVFAVAVVLTGFSSALRGALWTVQELR